MRVVLLVLAVLPLAVLAESVVDSLSLEERLKYADGIQEHIDELLYKTDGLHRSLGHRAGVVPGDLQGPKLDVDVSFIESLAEDGEVSQLLTHMVAVEHLQKFKESLDGKDIETREPHERFEEVEVTGPKVTKKSLKSGNGPYNSAARCSKCKGKWKNWRQKCTAECFSPYDSAKKKRNPSRKSFFRKVTEFFHDPKKSGCPKPKLSWKCMAAWLPHLYIIGASGNLNFVVAGVEVVTDYNTFETGIFGYGGISAGTNIKSFVDASVYAGIGYKGSSFGSSLQSAYSGYFLSADAGGEFFASVGGIAAVSAKSLTGLPFNAMRPLWKEVKTICVVAGLGLSPPSFLTGNIASTWYSMWYRFKCTHPHCYAAVLLVSPPYGAISGTVQKTVAMKLFMDKYCKKSAYRNSAVCKIYRKAKQLAKEFIAYLADKGAKALKAGKIVVKAIARIATQPLIKSIQDADNVMKKHVGPALDRWRARNGLGARPEDKQNYRSIPIPSGKGLYFKVHSCTWQSDIKRPYIRCYPTSGNIRSTRDTTIGVRGGIRGKAQSGPSKSYAYFHYKKDESKSGWGTFWRGATGRCIKCYFRYAKRAGHSILNPVGLDSAYRSRTFSLCTSGKKYRWVNLNNSRRKCKVMFHRQA